MGESIGGQETPCLADLSQDIGNRYWGRMGWDIALVLGLSALRGDCCSKMNREHNRPENNRHPLRLKHSGKTC